MLTIILAIEDTEEKDKSILWYIKAIVSAITWPVVTPIMVVKDLVKFLIDKKKTK
jgi:hypothetical protein